MVFPFDNLIVGSEDQRRRQRECNKYRYRVKLNCELQPEYGRLLSDSEDCSKYHRVHLCLLAPKINADTIAIAK